MEKQIKNNKPLPWDEVEKAIFKEIEWLRGAIIPSPFEKDFCTNCTLRQIAILMMLGKIKAKDISSTTNSFWGGEKMNIKKPHGATWHFEMMKTIGGHFKSLGFEVKIEPTLAWGRADLGIYKKGTSPLFVEVGTVSLPKLLRNLKTMHEKSTILLVPQEDHVIEFTINETDIKYRQ
ncbi:MAG: hypothetical protein A3D44_01870 [Candidatus Staskawiczbacteria bacterium RIFCSPHIGHO2_02_FULL_42_22]|uniref:Uncharacterized protein n=1 Tax=Candidatus Staskawiczbacteria bacterium RIFCSPHIGHO2_02_FULL_42_22 TaxID=1802207 RepID=A0A1G2I4U1_9BACT|nr:MAG: hypothetical protein A3D44_01870 [Candidatus Staskawiczbacteria bacterium RIFCSPHIGHO2_02_FULL_42_22]